MRHTDIDLFEEKRTPEAAPADEADAASAARRKDETSEDADKTEDDEKKASEQQDEEDQYAKQHTKWDFVQVEVAS